MARCLDNDIEKMLREQLERLSELSKKTEDETAVVEISRAMCQIAETLR